ncbi:MAG: GNAT family N-acetyltransferase [Actinomycetota bacterium]|nr:GNAT family N-acetyltransferase [Actinomycetota bacterium]
MARVEVIEAEPQHKEVLRHLLELYLHDFSEYDGGDVDDNGRYGYEYLDRYWTEPNRRPLLLRVDRRWAGFALVRLGEPHDVAEFCVLRKYRRSGVGTVLARDLFDRFPGEWQVRQLSSNTDATMFWRNAIPVAFVEELREEGPIQKFTIPVHG